MRRIFAMQFRTEVVLEKRKRKITVRLNDEEYRHLKTQATNCGMKMEPLIRRLIMGLNIRPRPPDQYAVLLRELSAIGNNINQIAYWANARKDISPRDIQDAKAYVTQAWRLVKEKL